MKVYAQFVAKRPKKRSLLRYIGVTIVKLQLLSEYPIRIKKNVLAAEEKQGIWLRILDRYSRKNVF